MKEQRYSEVRAVSDGEFKIEGYAARYGTVAQLGDFDETIMPGAFDGCEDADVKCLLNHDASVVLGRTTSGTLKLEADSIGLRFECQLNRDSEQHRNVYAAIKRGDINECSFAFTVPAGGQELDRSGDVPLRKLRKVNLLDVSAVTYPAYKEGTHVNARTYFDAEARSALGTVLGKPLRAPQNLVDLDDVRKRVDLWNRQRAAQFGAIIEADEKRFGMQVASDLVTLNRAIVLAQRNGEDPTTLEELWSDTYIANKKHLAPMEGTEL
jgi:uncharacterized protein